MEAPPACTPKSALSLDANKGASDRKSYRLLTLENEMKVLLVSEPGMDDGEDPEAAVALAVAAGSFDDKNEALGKGQLEGRAHLTEHLLFMGSERFPDENDYDSYIAEHGGSCNAFTEAEWTCFHIALRQSALNGGLDRLAAVMDAPLLREDTVAREVLAIESEFQQARLSDGPRAEQILAASLRPGHPAAAFLWGNRKSLVDDAAGRGLVPRDEVEAFVRHRYLPSAMRLVVRAARPLDAMQDDVVRRFSGVGVARAAALAAGDGGAGGAAPTAPVEWASPLAPRPSGIPAVVRWRPVAARLALSLAWVLPPVRGWWRADPAEYVSHCLGHEGAGSLLSHLRNAGLAASLSAGVSQGGLDESAAFCTFEVGVSLTSEGAARWGEVAAAVFAYLRVLRSCGPSKAVWDELCRSERLQYDFGDEGDAEEQVQGLAGALITAALPPHPGAEAAWRAAAAGTAATDAPELAPDGPVPDAELLSFSAHPTGTFAAVSPRVEALLAAMTPEGVRVSLAAPAFAAASSPGAPAAPGPDADASCAAGGSGGQRAEIPRAGDAVGQVEAAGPGSGAGGRDGHEMRPPRDPKSGSSADDDDASSRAGGDDDGDDADHTADEEDEDEDDEDDSPPGAIASLPPRALEALAPLGLDRLEPWFGTPYRVDDVPADVLGSWESPPAIPSLRLPSPNPFLPASPPEVRPIQDPGPACSLGPASPLVAASEAAGDTVLDLPQSLRAAAVLGSPVPALLSSTPAGRLWLVQDRARRRPVTFLTAQLFLRPLAPAGAADDPVTAAAAELWCDMASDAAQEVVYTAHMAGLSLTSRYGRHERALLVEVEGFSPKLPALLTALLQALVRAADPAAPGAPARFGRLREVASRRAASMHLKPAAQADAERLRLTLREPLPPREARTRGLAAVTLEDVAALARASLDGGSGIFAEVCVAGNETPASARAVFAAALGALGTGGGDPASAAETVDPASLRCTALAAPPLAPHRVVALLPRGCRLTRRVVPPRPGTRSASACLYFQCASPHDAALAASLRLLEALLEEPLFDQLRTREQLGYTVYCQPKCALGVGGMAVVLQGSRHSAEHLRDRALAFLEGWAEDALPATDPERFATQRDALVDTLREPPRTTQELMTGMWAAVGSRCFDFGTAAAMAAQAAELTLADVVKLAKELLTGEARRLLVVLSDARHDGETGAECMRPCGWADAASAVAGRAAWDA